MSRCWKYVSGDYDEDPEPSFRLLVCDGENSSRTEKRVVDIDVIEELVD